VWLAGEGNHDHDPFQQRIVFLHRKNRFLWYPNSFFTRNPESALLPFARRLINHYDHNISQPSFGDMVSGAGLVADFGDKKMIVITGWWFGTFFYFSIYWE